MNKSISINSVYTPNYNKKVYSTNLAPIRSSKHFNTGTSNLLFISFCGNAHTQDKHDIDAVNLSAYIPTNISSLREITGIEGLNSENMHLHKKTIREWFKNPSLPKQDAEFNNSRAAQIFFDTIRSTNKAITSIEKITSQGVPVYVSAGNEGSDNINYLTFADGTISVGANDVNDSVAHYSAKHSLVNLYERGSYEILPVIRGGKTLGYNITGGKKVQIPYNKTAHGDIYVDKFNGKNINDVLADDNVLNKLITVLSDIFGRIAYFSGKNKEFQNYLFPVGILAKIEDKSEKETADLMRQGDYCTSNFKFFFKLDEKEKIVFCPSGRPNPKAVNKLWGTSFSSPKAMMMALKRKFSAII